MFPCFRVAKRETAVEPGTPIHFYELRIATFHVTPRPDRSTQIKTRRFVIAPVFVCASSLCASLVPCPSRNDPLSSLSSTCSCPRLLRALLRALLRWVSPRPTGVDSPVSCSEEFVRSHRADARTTRALQYVEFGLETTSYNLQNEVGR